MKLLLVGNSGGHLNELLQLVKRLPNHQIIFASNKTKMTIGLAESYEFHYINKFIFRDLLRGKGLLNPIVNIFQSIRVLLSVKPDCMITSGAGVAFGLFILCKIFRVKVVFLESAARIHSCSTFGLKIGKYADTTLVQWGSLLNVYPNAIDIGLLFRNEKKDKSLILDDELKEPVKIFVTVGTYELQFDRLFKELDRCLSEKKINAVVTAQVGSTNYTPENFNYFDYCSQDQIHKLINDSDIVICQGGCGSIMDSLSQRKKVIAVPRLVKFGEYSDNHQLELVQELERLGFISAVYDDITNLSYVINSINLSEAPPRLDRLNKKTSIDYLIF